MAKKQYESIGIFPLEFPDGQQVEAGEKFERDFDATTGEEHARWLISLGHIREITPVSKTPVRLQTKEVKDVNPRTD